MDAINKFVESLQDIAQNKVLDISIALLVIAIFLLISPILAYLIIKLFKFKEKDKEKIKNNAFYKPLRAFFATCGVYLGIIIIDLPDGVMNVCTKIFLIIIILIVAKAAINLVDPKKGIVKKFQDDDKIDGNKTVTSFTGKILKIVIYVLAAFLILYVFGIDLSGLMTSLGVVSAVVVLAAQEFVKDLISGFSIISDKPFLVGDWIAINNTEGEVLEISYRTTKIKTADNTIVTIQNSLLTTNAVVNWSRLKQRRFVLNLKLPLETNSDKIAKVVNRIKFVLNNNDDVDKKTLQVHFDQIETDDININICFYTNIVVYNDYLKFKENVNKDILKILESENLKMAYPGQNVYIHNMEDEESPKVEIEEKAKTKDAKK